MTLKLGLPSKGRLQAQAVEWFGARGITVERTGSEREYAGAVRGVDGVDLVLLSAAEIPRELAAGRIHLGVTGQDMVAETLPPGRVETVAELGFGRADLIVAVPDFWIDVRRMDDLDAAAAAFRARVGHRLRVATKYHTLVRGCFTRHGVADYQLVDSQGATEGTVLQETAEAIADITSTGATLEANHLRVLEDGLILSSQAALFAVEPAAWPRDTRAVFDQLRVKLGV